jgi:hypothetical protein
MAAGWRCSVLGAVPEIGLEDPRLSELAALVRAELAEEVDA